MSRHPWAQRAVAAAFAAVALGLVAAAPPAHAQARGELVRIPFSADDGTLTPYTFTGAYALMTLVYDTLLWRDEDGTPRPWLARSVRTSADGRRLDVRLAPKARWHDGVPLTANDVAFTLDYVRRNEHPRFTPQLRELAGVTVTGRHSLTIRLRRPSPGFRDQPLADLPILPRHIWAAQPAGEVPPGLPVGSGPYRLVRHPRGGGYTFAANERYFLGPPGVRRIEIPIMSGDRTTLAFERGDVDLVRLVSLTGTAAGFERTGTGVARGSGYQSVALLFNLRRAPFDDPQVRRAVAQAIDLPRIARAVAGSGDPIEPALNGLVHPQSRWATAERLHTFDPAAARAVLARSTAPNLRVLASRADLAAATGREVVAALRRAGARATLVMRSERAVQDAIGADGARADFDLAIGLGSPLVSYDPDALRSAFGAGGPLNYSGYRSPAFERLADRVTTTREPRARRAAVAEELRLLARDLPAVPLFFDVPTQLYRRAAWNRWTFVKGAGAVDKRSFLPRIAASRPQPAETVAAAAPDDEGIGVTGFVAVGLLGLAAAIVVVGSLRWRR